MEYRALGKTGLEVSAVSYGAIKLPQIPEEEAAECLNRALDLGINFIDTARRYKDSENKIGAGLAGRRDDFYLATKTGERTRDGALADLQTSLEALRMDHVDLWQLHSVSDPGAWEQVMGPGGALEALHEAREQGLARHVGVTIHRSLDVMRRAIECGEYETVMLCYNPMDSEGVAPFLPLAREHGVGTIIMKALSGGMIPYPAEAREAGLGGPDALVAGSLRWVLSHPCVDVVIPGMRAVHEVEENVAVASPFTPLADEERDELRRRLASRGASYRYDQQCLRCEYCLPCPRGVKPPEVFKAVQMVAAYPDPLKHMGYDLYEQMDVKADACAACGVCVERCPVGLDIPRLLGEAHQVLSARP